MSSRLLLLIAALLLSSATSFTLPTPASPRAPSSGPRAGGANGADVAGRGAVRPAARSDDGEPAKKVPFSARLAKRLLGRKGGRVAPAPAEEGTNAEFAAAPAPKGAGDDVPSPALMKAAAARARLEAERDELALALDKIERLEGKVENLKAANGDEKKRMEILKEVASTARRLGPVESSVAEAASASDSAADGKVRSDDSAEEETNVHTNQTPEGAVPTPPALSPEQLARAIQAFEKLPPPLKDVAAKTVGLPSGRNATAVVSALLRDGRLAPDADGQKFAFSAALDPRSLDPSDVEIFVDPDFVRRNAYVSGLFPECTRKFPAEEGSAESFAALLGRDTFLPAGRAEGLPGGYIVRGENRVEDREGRSDGDLLIEALDRRISSDGGLAGVNFYYVLDPTPASSEETANGEDELPVLLLTGCDIAPSTEVWVKPLVSLLGILSVAGFALGAFSMNMDVVSRVEQGGDLGWLVDFILPVVVGVLGVQLVHESGHWIVALMNGISIGFPTVVPSFQLGITGAITPIKSPPKNVKSLFDLAIAGPMFGLVASLGLLYLGLDITAASDAAAIERLPSVPASLLRSSTLGSGIIEYLLGAGLLNTPDPTTAMVKLHPYAIAGFVGLITNAISLLPIGNTDGGRISIAFFGRSFSRVVHGFALLTLALSGLFGADESNIFISYALYCQFWQREPEIPCRNEVDELDTIRGFVAIAVSVFVALTLIPLQS